MSLFYDQNKAKLEALIENSTLSTGATILIPNLQRAYVWNPDAVVLLIDSLIKGWPFGSLLMWAVVPSNMPDSSVPSMPKRSFWSLISRVDGIRDQCLPEAREPTPYQMVLDGQQRLQSLVIALKGMAYGFQLYDHEWARALELPIRKETQHWSRGCLHVDLAALSKGVAESQGVIDWVDFKQVLVWTVQSEADISSGRSALQKTPLKEFRLGDPLIPLSKFWEKALVTHVRQPNKYEVALESLFTEFRIDDDGGLYKKSAESLLDKLAELKATDVHYLEVLPYSSAFDLDQYNDAVINIFTRLNSAGRTLEPEEITFAWIKMNWQPSAYNGKRLADKCFEELAEQISDKANLSLDTNQMVRGMSAVWATLFSNGTLLKDKDFLKADKLKPMAVQLSECWNKVAEASLNMSVRINSLDLKFRETYFSLNALFVLWGLESVVNTWEGRARLKTVAADTFDKNYESLLKNSIDRWFLLSQWAGVWSQSDAEFSKYLEQMTGLKRKLADITDETQAIAAISMVLNLWLDEFKPNARQFVENLNANSRNSVRQYFGPLWIWNRLNIPRWEIAKIHLREFDRRKSKILETDVDHIVAVNLWKTKTMGELTSEDAARTVNSIGNCSLLERTFNISKSAESAYSFFKKINEFSTNQITFAKFKRYFLIPSPLLRPTDRDKQKLVELIEIRERKIKDELKSYIDGLIGRVDI